MASNRRTLAICDTCGFQYPHRVMKLNSYGLLVCPMDFEGAYDLKNSPLNKSPMLRKLSAGCKAAAKRKFKVYPSAYANMWASKQQGKGKC